MVANIAGTEAEVLALHEAENNGFGAGSGIRTLAGAQNANAAATGSGAVLAVVDPAGTAGFVGTDAITATVIYNSNAVTLIKSDVLSYAWASSARTFALAEVLHAIVAPSVRLNAATELADCMANACDAATGYLLLGDMNAHAEADPVQYLDDTAGLVDLTHAFIGQDRACGYVFDGQRGTLDQGFASTDLAAKVAGVAEWHINADEPDLISIDTTFKDPRFYNDRVFGSSDHDPLIIGLALTPPLIVG